MNIDGHGMMLEVEDYGRVYISDGQGEGPATDLDGLRWLVTTAGPALLDAARTSAAALPSESPETIPVKQPVDTSGSDQIPGQLTID